MKNETNLNAASYRFRPGIWINDVIFTVILLFTSLYYAVALLYHQTKIKQRHHKTVFQLSLEKRYGVMSKYTCILIAFVSLLRNLNQIGFLAMDGVAFYSAGTTQITVEVETACNVLARLANTYFAAGSSLVYLFLWLRQSIFYVQPHLKVLNKKWVSGFSLSVLIFYLTFGIILFVVYIITFQYKINELGFCQSESNLGSDGWSYSALILVFSLGSILMQIALLWLFVNPLLKRRLWRDTQQAERSCRLMQRVKKAIVLASICIGTDIFTSAANFFLYEEHANRVVFPYSVNLIINCSVAIACFDCWKHILWPWKMKSQKIASKLSLEKCTRSVPLSQPMTKSFSK